MKNKDVCIGCKYHAGPKNSTLLDGTCEYLDKTGKSRLAMEKQNGGYRKDSCICYERGKRKHRKVKPVVAKGEKKI